MKKINIEELKELNYSDGEKLLLSVGYIQQDVVRENIVQDREYFEDTYFVLFDENENHVFTFYQYIIDDVVVRQTWAEL